MTENVDYKLSRHPKLAAAQMNIMIVMLYKIWPPGKY
jgi:hypothetical protein